jgi:hypothetical protein
MNNAKKALLLLLLELTAVWTLAVGVRDSRQSAN